jgi:hypothetical protein
MTLSALAALPPLQDKHRIALEQAFGWLRQEVDPVGVVASGSIVRGNPGPSSDLDLVVLHGQPWRRRVQRWFNGTPVELFFNSEDWLNHCIRAEAAEGRPVMAHMLATGTLLLDGDGRMAALCHLSRRVLEGGPNLSANALLRDRYAAATLVEDALDFGAVDSADARRLRALAVDALARHEHLRHNRFLPRPKERLSLLSQASPGLGNLLARALSESSAAADALREAAEQVLGTAGFFEWDSGVDSAPPPNRR